MLGLQQQQIKMEHNHDTFYGSKKLLAGKVLFIFRIRSYIFTKCMCSAKGKEQLFFLYQGTPLLPNMLLFNFKLKYIVCVTNI